MYRAGIRERGQFETAVPTGRVPFVATEDIARAAFEGIVNRENHEVEQFIIIGPELLTFDEVSAIKFRMKVETHAIYSSPPLQARSSGSR